MVYGGRACSGTGTLLAAKRAGPVRRVMAGPPWTSGAYMDQRRATLYLPRIIAGAKALGKPCSSLILAAPSGTVAMAFGRRLYALLTRKAAWVTDMCTVLYELE